jgi:hexosaminidase
MTHPVIPAPIRFDPGAGRFPFRADTRIAYTAPAVAPIVERFCSEVRRRTGLSVTPMAGHPGPGEPSVRIELASRDGFAALRAPQGVSPWGDAAPDERHSVTVAAGQVVLRAAEPAGVARGLTTLIQLLAAVPSTDAAEISLPGGRILDAPRYAWRGLSLDPARRFFTPDEVRRVIDLLALYKLNVLHLHLTDDQGWRLPLGRPGGSREPGAAFYSADDLRALITYAADRFVTVVPEVDMPGHASALMRMRPELNSGRNQAELPLGAAWLDPELPATFTLVEDLLAGVAEIFPSPYIQPSPYGSVLTSSGASASSSLQVRTVPVTGAIGSLTPGRVVMAGAGLHVQDDVGAGPGAADEYLPAGRGFQRVRGVADVTR